MPRSDRFVATVLFTDIVGSTELAARLGDRGWRRVLKAHHALIRQELRRFGGREVDTAGDGFFASFPVPADAARCALAITSRMWDLGIAVRAGIHTGEFETVERKVGGIAVHIGSRAASLAGPGEVLATSTVRDMVTGSGLRLEDRGAHTLKGVPGEWSLFAVDDRSAARRGALPDLDPSLAPPEGDEPSGRRRPRRQVTAAIVAVGTLASVVLVLVLLPSKDRVVPTNSPPQKVDTVGLIRLDPATGKIDARIEFGLGEEYRGLHTTIAVDGEGYLHTVDDILSELYKIDPRSNTVVGRRALPVPDALSTRIVVGDGRLWVAVGSTINLPNFGTRLLRVDQHTLKSEEVRRFPGTTMNGLAHGEGALWLTMDEGQLVRIDPDTGKSRTVDLGSHTPGAIAVGEGHVWVTDLLAGTLLRIHPRSMRITGSVPLEGQPRLVSVGAGAIWVTELQAGERGLVQRFPPDLASNSATFQVGAGARDVEVAAGSAWVSNRNDGTISRIDLATGAITATTVAGAPDGLLATDDAIWVVMVRLNPLS